ncbi:histidine phosphatase family protein [Loktanella sp. SALINAS62]|uniref:histidine phosphatase family protein n=1 Tax=Loktanella sp. SALINAS62 TaxID=2706124 RepID=UPI001B8B8A70|nr:histidine phosphatase family protein [Loktanella sp. SALINAS62]MBS1301599.1 histidine phosphatase family protein [Loktanella sp. SALINAS62]
MTYPDLYILRHGETLWNAEGRMQGHLNSPLSPRGLAQAARQADIMASRDLPGFACYASPLGRAVQTAALVLGPLVTTIRTDDRLMEIDVGAWAGLLRRDLVTGELVEGPDGDVSIYARAPGEGMDALFLRARAFLDDLDGPAVLVCHGIISRVLRVIVLGLDRDALADLPGGQGNVFYLSQGTQQELR